MRSNTAAFLNDQASPSKPSQQGTSRLQRIENEPVIKNHAIAINSVNGSMQNLGNDLFPWMKFPHVRGSNVAGEVGPGVTRFKVGDRICGLAMGVPLLKRGKLNGAFQTFTLLNEVLAASIPDSLSHQHAVVTSLGISTAACGLYQGDHLGLILPSLTSKSRGQFIVT